MEIRILLARMPRMLREILVNVIDAEGDMRVVSAGDGEADAASAVSAAVSAAAAAVRVQPRDAALAARVASERPDVVIVGLERGELPTVCGELLGCFPHLKVLAIEERGRQASLYELRPVRTVLRDVSAHELVASIRGAARPVAAADASIGGGAP